MPRFFTTGIGGDMATVTGEDARHISRALRCRVGEQLTLCDGAGNDYLCTITALTDNEVTLAVLQSRPSASEPPVKITLYQAMPKGDKAELIVQKAVELGVCRVVFILTDRCVSRPDSRSMEKKLERLNKISLEAAKQSGRGVVPPVEGLLSLQAALNEMRQSGAAVLFYENAEQSLGKALPQGCASIAILIGSEGGFEPAEAQSAAEAGLAVCSMGPRILRCETAPLYALSAITYHYENR